MIEGPKWTRALFSAVRVMGSSTMEMWRRKPREAAFFMLSPFLSLKKTKGLSPAFALACCLSERSHLARSLG